MKLLNYKDIVRTHNTRIKLNGWINEIYRYFWRTKAEKYYVADIIIDEISYIKSLPIITGPEFRYCIKFIRSNLLHRKIIDFKKQMMKWNFEPKDIPKSYVRSLFWISANSNGYAKTYDLSHMEDHKKSLEKRKRSLINNINTIDSLSLLLQYDCIKDAIKGD